ncbi:L-type lectin-domain containing receptor kinase IX.2 [Setaria viridis]|nr:probable L-type lectin-domain containing receptor kinase S.5 [Setaria viridis]
MERKHRPELRKLHAVMGFPLRLQVVVWLSILVLLSIPYSHSKSCGSLDDEQHPSWELDYYTFSTRLDRLHNYKMVNESGFLGDFTRHDVVDMPKDALGLLHIPLMVQLCSFWTDLDYELQVRERSFAVSFTMSLYQQPSWKKHTTTAAEDQRQDLPQTLSFLILPVVFWELYDGKSLAEQLKLSAEGTLALSEVAPGGGSNVSVEIGKLAYSEDISLACPYYGSFTPLGVNVAIIEPAAATASYTVWIEYLSSKHSLSVYVCAGKDSPRPKIPIAVKEDVRFADGAYSSASFALFSLVGQLLQVHAWNSTVVRHQLALTDGERVTVSIFIGMVIASMATAAGVFVVCTFRSIRRRWKEERDEFARTMQRLPGVPIQIEFADIRMATNNFHDTAKLGKGGFGSVYGCTLPATATRTEQAMEVAVKKFTGEVKERRYEDFLAEVSIINRLRHKNIVPLVGWSYNKGDPLLIYEYMTYGSLDQHLFRGGGNGDQRLQQEDASSIRQWHSRYSIARDIATGLHYVHHEHEPMVLHRDIKASNIMLDSNFHARLGDFGIACTVAADRSSVTGIAGTWGYISPEYAMSRRATRQTDIYAFGVLILEVVTGKKNRDVPPDDGHISDWVWRLHGEGRLLDAVDDHQQAVVVDEAERLLLLGLACTNPDPTNRPSMAVAVQVISKLAPPPDVPPERPAFVWPPKEWRSLDSDYCTTESNLGGISTSTVELVQIMQDQPPPETQSSSTRFFSV